MEPELSIPLQDDLNYYLWFYLAGFFVGFAVIALRCRKIKANLPFYSMLTATIFLASIIGCKLVTVVEYWIYPSIVLPEALFTTQMALGGAIVSFITILILHKLFRLPGAYVYSIGLATLAALFIQKPGCFLGGCCMGMEVTNFAGISYGGGIVRHPLQIYEMIFYGIALVVLIKLKVKNKASKYFLALAFFSLIQLCAEFLRAPEFTMAFAEKFIGLKLLQWIYLLFGILNLILCLLSEKMKEIYSLGLSGNSIAHNIVLLILVVSVFYLVHPYLYPLEIYAINIAFLPAVIFAAVQLFNYVTVPGYRWAAISILLLPLLLMSQTIPKEEKVQKEHKTVGIGYHGGNFTNRITNDINPGSCGGPTYSREFKQKYNIITLRYAVTKTREKVILSYGTDASFGKLEEQTVGSSNSTGHTIATVNPFIRIDLNWLGIGAGAHIGSNYYALTKSHYESAGTPETGLGFSPFYPQAYFRVGPKRFFALEYNFANKFPCALPAFTHEFVLGSGFGVKNGLYFKYGVLFGSQSEEDVGNYLSAYIPIDNMVVLEPLIGFGSMENVYMLGLSYRFSHRLTNYTP